MNVSLGHLEQLRNAEECNYTASLSRLGQTATLIDDFSDAYRTLNDLLRQSQDPPEHLLAVSILLLSTEYQLEKACLECVRGHLTDSVQITRRAIESAAFAARIARHPHLAPLWFRASTDDGSYDEYKDKFSPKKIFPKDDELLAKLEDRWDHASRVSHSSAYSVARRSSIHLGEGSLEFGFKVFETDDEDRSEPARTLLYILDTHLGILRVFEKVLREQLGDLFKSWEVRRNGLDAKLAAYKELWRDVILTAGADEETNDEPDRLRDEPSG
jgi:hypothetical protein